MPPLPPSHPARRSPFCSLLICAKNPTSRKVGKSKSWNVGKLECWQIGKLASWESKMAASWNVGKLANRHPENVPLAPLNEISEAPEPVSLSLSE